MDDQSPESLVAATLQFQMTYDFDLVKITPASSFCVKDWGVKDSWKGNPEGTREYTKRVINQPEDWEKLPLLRPTAAYLAAQITCLNLIRNKLRRDTPILQTIFNPLAQAKNLAGGELLLTHLRLYPEFLAKGLQTIAETTRLFVETCIEAGIDGIFYAIQHAQSGLLSLEEYEKFGTRYDRTVLEPAQTLWCNLLHLHGQNIYFPVADHSSFPIINWHDRESLPSLSQGQTLFNGALCGGLRQDTLVFGTKDQVIREAQEAFLQTGGRRFILGTGCVVPIIAPYGNILAARQSVDKLRI